MHTISDVFFWRSIFLLVMIATLIAGVLGWRIAVWIAKLTRSWNAHKPLIAPALRR